MERLLPLPPVLPRLTERSYDEEEERVVKRAKFHKQSTSFAALEEDEHVLRHGEGEIVRQPIVSYKIVIYKESFAYFINFTPFRN